MLSPPLDRVQHHNPKSSRFSSCRAHDHHFRQRQSLTSRRLDVGARITTQHRKKSKLPTLQVGVCAIVLCFLTLITRSPAGVWITLGQARNQSHDGGPHASLLLRRRHAPVLLNAAVVQLHIQDKPRTS